MGPLLICGESTDKSSVLSVGTGLGTQLGPAGSLRASRGKVKTQPAAGRCPCSVPAFLCCQRASRVSGERPVPAIATGTVRGSGVGSPLHPGQGLGTCCKVCQAERLASAPGRPGVGGWGSDVQGWECPQGGGQQGTVFLTRWFSAAL